MEHMNPEEIGKLIGEEVKVYDYFFTLKGVLKFHEDVYFIYNDNPNSVCETSNGFVFFDPCKVREIYRNPGMLWSISLSRD